MERRVYIFIVKNEIILTVFILIRLQFTVNKLVNTSQVKKTLQQSGEHVFIS